MNQGKLNHVQKKSLLKATENVLGELSATLPLPDYGRVARHSAEIDFGDSPDCDAFPNPYLSPGTVAPEAVQKYLSGNS
jgi:hypothetical protein